MASNRLSFEIKTRVFASLACATLALTMFALSSCGVLSAPDRDETPSALALRAQYAYDKGDFSEAVELLEKLKKIDPSNTDARIKLAFSYMGAAGISHIDTIKKFATLGSSGGDVSTIINNAGLSAAQVAEIKSADKKVTLLTAEELRGKSAGLTTLHNAFLSLCELFSENTISTLKESAKSASSIIEIEKCGSGINRADGSVSIAALFLAINQFASLGQILDLDADGDGKIDIETSTSKASNDVTNAPDLNTLTRSLKALTDAADFLSSDAFKWAFSQFKVIDAVVVGSNLPDEVKNSITKITTSLNESIDKINGYVDQGASAGASAGEKAKETATKANQKADALLSGKSDDEKKKACQDVYCMRKSFSLPTTEADMPSECGGAIYASLSEDTCSQ
jgi:tetratricopeptide (TPR) repeat protein